MRESSNVLTWRFWGLDRKVWMAITLVVITCFFLLSFRLLTEETCPEVIITVTGFETTNATTFKAGTPVLFKATGASDISWNFDDQSEVATGTQVNHQFKEGGTYVVAVTANGKCMFSKVVHIQSVAPAQPVSTSDITIEGPEVLAAGTAGAYRANASDIEWSVYEDAALGTQQGSTATFTFYTPGSYNIRIRFNGTSRMFMKEVKVTGTSHPGKPTTSRINPAPSEEEVVIPHPIGPTAIERTEDDKKERHSVMIDDIKFVYMLNDAIKGTMNIQDFDEFLCNGARTKVLVEGKFESFGSFFKRIYNSKNYRITSVHTDRDEHKCVIKMTIERRRGGLLKRIFR